MNILKKLKERETVIENQAEKYLYHHPCVGLLLTVVGMPILVLSAVTIFTAVIAFPISYFMGWL